MATTELNPGKYQAVLSDFLYTGSKAFTFVFVIEDKGAQYRLAVRRICTRHDYETYEFLTLLLGHSPDYNRLSLKELLGKTVMMTVGRDEDERLVAVKFEKGALA